MRKKVMYAVAKNPHVKHIAVVPLPNIKLTANVKNIIKRKIKKHYGVGSQIKYVKASSYGSAQKSAFPNIKKFSVSSGKKNL